MTARAALLAATLRLPAPTTSSAVERNVSVRMRDGAVLLADIWSPKDSAGGTVLLRTPYDRQGLDVLAEILASRGHRVVVQNCRGTFGSDGRFEPFRDEVRDGADTLSWLRAQPWVAGPVSLLGASYLGHTAYALASEDRDLSAVVLAVTAADFRSAVIYPSNVFSLETGLIWIAGLLTQERSLLRRILARVRLRHRMPGALLTTAAEADHRLLGHHYPPYQDWLTHDQPDDPWWEAVAHETALEKLPPSALIGGWYDPFLTGLLDDHRALVERGRPTRLVIGPWTHGSPGVLGSVLRESIRLLDRGRSAEQGGEAVIVHDRGRRRWVRTDQWPPPARRHTLALDENGALRARPTGRVQTSWLMNPLDPPPPAGGRALNPDLAGRRDQHARENRDDVKTFSTGRLKYPITIAGAPQLILHSAPARGSEEWFVRLCDVDRLGVSRNVCDGYLRVASHDTAPLHITLASTAHTFKAGHRLRLQLSGSGHPFHPVLENDNGTRTLLSTPEGRTELVLPVIEGGWEASSVRLTRSPR